ncbi:hypothetical protein FA15DRAFT_701922 [Coprinopsis marcescibilis]|uniref:DNase I-like protein n=1 Tax=Coprinopsis marcescibilis TaxID=230819 RepID=A0A5C3L4I7_COPMA|nr:hypothetical protein FA15DRAFT_701922 [Coprinopsis marcescibilis]
MAIDESQPLVRLPSPTHAHQADKSSPAKPLGSQPKQTAFRSMLDALRTFGSSTWSIWFLRRRRQHAFVIGETKTQSKVCDSLPHHEYNVYEESGVKADGHHILKWGMALGICKDLQVLQQAIVKHASLKGRVVAVDVALPTPNSKCFKHRLIAGYAPWNPGGDNTEGSFWSNMANFCNESPHPWTLAGDLNATILTKEMASGGTDARAQYLGFLQKTKGEDHWTKIEDRDRLINYTCKGHNKSAKSGNIIDQVMTSADTLLDSFIEVGKKPMDWVPFTDHRPIAAHITLYCPKLLETSNQNYTTLPRQQVNAPCIVVPAKTEKHKYEDFRIAVDKKTQDEGLHSIVVDSLEAFTQLYDPLT